MTHAFIPSIRPRVALFLAAASVLAAFGPAIGEGAPRAHDAQCRGSATPLRIVQPAALATVGERPIVQGTARAGSEVWLIVRPMAVSDYWVQSVALASEGCVWRVQANIGMPGPQHVGQHFELMAVMGPRPTLREGQVLGGWPAGAQRSQLVEVVRGR